jgi:hypothetical protein
LIEATSKAGLAFWDAAMATIEKRKSVTRKRCITRKR